ncbi:MAG TPA: glycosyl hydrolase [Clostridiales bacterium]|nr:glycosyl hydrolase [Clostridiales bacterium]
MLTSRQEQQLQDILARMSPEEKIGQLQQRGPSLVGAFDVDFEELVNMVYDGRISKEKFDEMLSSSHQDYHEKDLRAGRIGSYNGIADAKTACALQKIAVEETRMGIPLLFGYDILHGYRTITPIPLGESCAWDPALWRKTARMAAEEGTSSGIQMTFAPMVDVAKDARWGRIAECAGEDTLLNAVYGAAKVRGFQGDDLSQNNAMAACVKHFAAYGAAESGRDYNRVDLSRQRLYEDYLPPFEACVRAGARAVMPAFNDINGVPCTVNHWLLHELLRDEWGFDGMTVSDANAIAECVSHGVAADKADAALQALNAGIDMDMASNAYAENLQALLNSGRLEMAVLDRAVAHVLRVKFELGLFDDPYQTCTDRERSTLLSPEHRALAREAAEKSIVLLKNNGVLPLTPDLKLGVVGTLAAARDEMTGTWAIKAKGEDCVSILDACAAQHVNHVFIPDSSSLKGTDCDAYIVAVGEKKSQSGEAASRACIDLSAEQLELLKTALSTGKPVVAVLFNGRPLALPWVAENIPAILEAWHPGIEAGTAILDILLGRVNPSGKLTTTFPHSAGQCPVYYDHISTGRPAGKSKFTSKYLDAPMTPVFPFGHGLSYTSFEYDSLNVARCETGLRVDVYVKNTGSRDGDEIVQCYIHDPVAKRVRPVKKLLDFNRVSIPAGEGKPITIHIPLDRLGYYHNEMDYIVEDGEMEIFVGGGLNSGLRHTIVIDARIRL